MHFSLTSRRPYRLKRLSIRLKIIRVPSVEQFRFILISPSHTPSICTLNHPSTSALRRYSACPPRLHQCHRTGSALRHGRTSCRVDLPNSSFHLPQISFHLPEVRPYINYTNGFLPHAVSLRGKLLTITPQITAAAPNSTLPSSTSSLTAAAAAPLGPPPSPSEATRPSTLASGMTDNT